LANDPTWDRAFVALPAIVDDVEQGRLSGFGAAGDNVEAAEFEADLSSIALALDIDDRRNIEVVFPRAIQAPAALLFPVDTIRSMS
jgi:hypothetical protein